MPPAKRRPRTSETKRVALAKRLVQIQREIGALRRERAAITRSEFREVTESLRRLHGNTDEIAKHARELATQFTRIANMQAELDEIKRALRKAKLL